MTIDERLEALTQTVELMVGMQKDYMETQKQDGEHIRALARIAEIHEHRLSQLEGGDAAH